MSLICQFSRRLFLNWSRDVHLKIFSSMFILSFIVPRQTISRCSIIGDGKYKPLSSSTQGIFLCSMQVQVDVLKCTRGQFHKTLELFFNFNSIQVRVSAVSANHKLFNLLSYQQLNIWYCGLKLILIFKSLLNWPGLVHSFGYTGLFKNTILNVWAIVWLNSGFLFFPFLFFSKLHRGLM